MAFLVQMILPVYDNDDRPFSPTQFLQVRRELTDRFGGVTAYTRAPAEGFWEDATGQTHRDDVVNVEVMTDTWEPDWWRRYASELATRFAQEEVVVRAIACERLDAAPSDAQTK